MQQLYQCDGITKKGFRCEKLSSYQIGQKNYCFIHIPNKRSPPKHFKAASRSPPSPPHRSPPKHFKTASRSPPSPPHISTPKHFKTSHL